MSWYKTTTSWIEQIQSANWSLASWIALGAYVLGCFTTGYYLVRVCTGRDIRDEGSGSVGAKNVGRLLGWTGFIVTVFGDVAKGSFAVWAASHWTTRLARPTAFSRRQRRRHLPGGVAGL